MKKGFDEVGFMEFLENEFTGFENHFLRETVKNIVDYGLEHNHDSLDQFCYWLSDMLPEVEFKEVVLYMDNAYLTDSGKAQKQEVVKSLDNAVESLPWLDELVRDAVLKQGATAEATAKSKEIFKNVLQHLNDGVER